MSLPPTPSTIEMESRATKNERQEDTEEPLSPPTKRPRPSTPSTPAKRPVTAIESRVEFSCDHVVKAARDSACCISVTLDVDNLFRDARVIYLTEDHASWVYYVPKWFRRIYTHCVAENEFHLPYSEWFQRLWDLHPNFHHTIKMFGKDVLTPRFQHVYGDVTYRFSGTTFEAKPFPEELLTVVRLLQALVVCQRTNETYLKSALVNWFAHGDHYIGPHSDDESALHVNAPIFSVSLGATRRFVFTPRANINSALKPAKIELLLNDGDLVVMGGTTQKTHKHAVPKMKKSAGKRMSVTMRCFKSVVLGNSEGLSK